MEENFEFQERIFNSLIKKIKPVFEKEKKLELLNKSYNIFEVLNLERKEVALHSYFIYDLLNPEAVHGKSSLFLKIFLEKVLGYKTEQLENFNTADYDIQREVDTGDGRIDFLIYDLKNKMAHIIEMKIDAVDQNKQLKRYDDYAQKNKNINNYKIYYLTLDGRKASEQSAKGIEYTPISFKYNIKSWLEEILKYLDTTSELKVFVEQYLKTIKNITDSFENDNIKKEYLECLDNNSSVIRYANSLTKQNNIIKNKVLDNLNEEIFEELKKFFSSKIKFDIKLAERYKEEGDYVSIYIKQIGNLKNIRFGVAADNKKLYFYIGICKNTTCIPFDEKTISKEPYFSCFIKIKELRKNPDYPYYHMYFYNFEKDENFILSDDKEYDKLKNDILIFMKEKVKELIKCSKGDE